MPHNLCYWTKNNLFAFVRCSCLVFWSLFGYLWSGLYLSRSDGNHLFTTTCLLNIPTKVAIRREMQKRNAVIYHWFSWNQRHINYTLKFWYFEIFNRLSSLTTSFFIASSPQIMIYFERSCKNLSLYLIPYMMTLYITYLIYDGIC